MTGGIGALLSYSYAYEEMDPTQVIPHRSEIMYKHTSTSRNHYRTHTDIHCMHT